MIKRSASGKFYSAASAPDAEIMDEAATATVDEWRKQLEISEAQLAAGDVVESAEVLRELDEAIARTKAKKAAAPQH
jgi:RNA polymerase-interacting CarD/CdnL/TRCF family regulator